MKRVLAAFRTNDAQIEAVVLLTALSIIACASRDSAPWWLWAFSALLWPCVAFVFNLLDPIPRQTGE